jgi:hypothetical protein
MEENELFDIVRMISLFTICIIYTLHAFLIYFLALFILKKRFFKFNKFLDSVSCLFFE